MPHITKRIKLHYYISHVKFIKIKLGPLRHESLVSNYGKEIVVSLVYMDHKHAVGNMLNQEGIYLQKKFALYEQAKS